MQAQEALEEATRWLNKALKDSQQAYLTVEDKVLLEHSKEEIERICKLAKDREKDDIEAAGFGIIR